MEYPLTPPNPILGVQYYTAFAIIWQRQLVHNYFANRTPLPLKDSYDFVVVGAGTAGCTVACRLAQWGKEVLLLEAGGPQNALMTDLPGMVSRNLQEDGYKLWPYVFTPQARAGQGFLGHVIPEVRGRIMGGTSAVNWMMYNRGNRKIFDELATKYGAVGWDYNNLLPLFKRSENNTDFTLDSRYHGRSGPIGISTPPLPDPILEYYIQAVEELGYPYNDINGATQPGVMLSQFFYKNGIRSTSANGFIESGICPTVTVVTGALVTKVNIDDGSGTPTAIGVQFIKNNETYCVGANKEVILSAGAIASPQLLMLSGIGPKQHLQEKGISPVYADLPVGDNFADHISVIANFPLRPGLVYPPPELETQQLYQANVNGTGLLAQLALTTFFYSTSVNPTPDIPDIDVYTQANPKNTPGAPTLFSYQDQNAWNDFFKDLNRNDYFSQCVCLGRPLSKGTIRLNTTNILDIPIINPNFLVDPIDFEAFVIALSDAFRLIESSSLSKYAIVNPRPIPGCSYCPHSPVSKCISYLKCHIRQVGQSMYHPVGTARMGDPRRPDTVVDPRCRVKGVNKLRVIDSSIWSVVNNANTNAPAFVAGEKGAILIYEDNI